MSILKGPVEGKEATLCNQAADGYVHTFSSHSLLRIICSVIVFLCPGPLPHLSIFRSVGIKSIRLQDVGGAWTNE